VHELGIATRLAEIAKQVMTDHGAAKVGEIAVDIGSLAGIDRSSLEFCFDAIAKGTPLEGAHLKIDEIRPRAKCRECGADYEVRLDDFRCRSCGSSDFDVTSGTDISVKSVEVE
jgi:hydrogenase nickel incorporation protein HypA/HybF